MATLSEQAQARHDTPTPLPRPTAREAHERYDYLYTQEELADMLTSVEREVTYRYIEHPFLAARRRAKTLPIPQAGPATWLPAGGRAL